MDVYVALASEQGVAVSEPTTPSVIAVRAVRWAELHRTRRPALALEVEKTLETELYYAVLDRFTSQTIATDERDLGPYLRRRPHVYLIEVAVTDLDPGLGLLRWAIGFYAGAARLQAEFRLRDARTNRLLASIAIRRAHPGDAHMGLNLMAMSARHTLRKLAPGMARDVIALTARILAGEHIALESIQEE